MPPVVQRDNAPPPWTRATPERDKRLVLGFVGFLLLTALVTLLAGYLA